MGMGKHVQATGDAISPQKKISSTLISSLFLFFWVMFGFLDKDPDPSDKNQDGSGSTILP
jgi:hypothetical protein